MVQASTRMVSVGTIVFMPSLKFSIQSMKDMSLRGTYSSSEERRAKQQEYSSALGAEVSPSASVMLMSFSKKPPR